MRCLSSNKTLKNNADFNTAFNGPFMVYMDKESLHQGLYLTLLFDFLYFF
tara:strand:- start:28608 stop:28757 length:150 start_codon:yes stop_codon:yes gene_type:complete